MAAELPVKDVLCEAMEYLSKLGANLRTRSENLKEKKINKVKLTNALAVQKAADKVLLICELSKKSLGNVEAGVRKVLEQIDVSQASSSIGGKSSTSKTDSRKRDDKPKYHYFEYKSHKLKIKNKISLKHYKSVKVHATKMSLAMLEKYPVNHDCKLYRLRRKKSEELSTSQNDKYLTVIPSETSESNEKSQENDDKENKNNGSDSDNSSKLACEVDEPHNNSDTNQTNKNRRRASEKSQRRNSKQSDKSNSPHKQSKDINEDSDDDVAINKTRKRKKINLVNSSEESNDKSSEPDSKKRKRSDDDSKQPSEVVDDVVSLNSDDGNTNLSETKNDNGTEVNPVKPLIKCVSLNKLLKPGVLNKITDKKPTATKKENKKIEFDVSKKNKMLREMLEKKKNRDEVFWAPKRKEVSAFQPKEFVINITRLPKFSANYLRKNNLKRITKGNDTVFDVSEEDKNDSTVEETSSEESSHLKHDKKQLSNSSPTRNDTDDEQLIAEANKVKSSLLNESDSDNDMDATSKNNEKSSETTINRIKNSLLNSDTDENEDILTDTASKAKKQEDKRTLSVESKSVNGGSDDATSEKTDKNQENPESDDQNKSDADEMQAADNDSDKSDASLKSGKNSDKEENGDDNKSKKEDNLSDSQIPSTPQKDNNAKKSLLDDSSDNAETPRSKKQRIKESADAKNVLMRYSSDSETEVVSLSRNVNAIKKSLQYSSSSSEDVVRKVKKKKSPIKKHSKKKKKYHRKSDNNEDSDSSDEENSTSSSRKMVRSKAKPGNSSSHSSDAQDPNDKHIDGLTNLRTLNKSRRRNSDSSDVTQSSKSTAMANQTTGLIGEELLKAESSSDGDSNDEVEAVDDDEELPTVTLTSGFNGGALGHLAKDDLLDESDSSVSVKADTKEDSEDEEEKLIAKRRKAANAISSDSETAETGAARKKNRDDDADVRISDFDDSDDSEPTKKSKRKKKADSDASANSDSDSTKKKRRRIKSVNDSDASGSDSENDADGKNKHGRKNIRKVMGKNQLEEATKRAARQEKERVARIQERQKMYNNLEFDESGKPDEVVLDKVVLDFDPETKEPLIAVDRGLVKKLKPHQANGIKFMWDACFESVKRIKKDKGSGCILAHCMGLGKTLQVVTLTHTLLAHDDLTKVHRVLVVCPLSTVLNWVNEFKMWLKYAHNNSDIDVYELSKFKQNSERAFQLSQWYEHGGVCVLGYEMFRNLSADNNKKFKKKMLKNFQESLVDPGPDLVVCDEGHLLKNEKTSLSQSMNRVKTLRRIVLTGTPLQNNLKEYYCMVQFVKPNLLGKYNEYLNRFVNPITNGQYTDSTDHDIRIMKRRSHVLHKMLDGAVQRRDYGVLAPFLPPKHEYVLFVTLSEVQTKLYQHYLDNYSRRPQPGKSSGFLFPDFQSLQRIWTHPLVLKYNSERYEIAQQKKRDKEEEEDSEGSLVNFIDDDSTPDESTAEESSDDSSECSDDSRKKSKKKKANKKSKGKDKDKDKEKEAAIALRRRGTRANPIDLEEDVKLDDDIMEVKYENPTEWWIKMVEEDVLEDMRNSHKLVLLFDILRQCEAIGDKLLVFSQSLYSLDLIEHFLGKVDEATQENRIDDKLGGHVGSWSQGVDYFRLDGSTSCENRSIWCKNFNREDNPRARLFLISTRAGGLGINLVAANRVVIFDVSWNPSHDVQSIFRVYRFGQKKPCYVYRFLAMGTMEEKIYERQVTKQAISKRVIDEQQIDRHYAENDLTELYKFEPQPPTPRPLPPLPKDRLFAEMLREHEAQIYKYHEHDSLLENKEEETLSEEERKAAWEDFENEKNRPPPAPFVSPWPMHNGMVPNMMVQQQQQLAYAALAAMLRKDVPNINDNQIRDMLPMIYNANPALMQKMSEIYKYSQMTPGMMASGMNSATSGGAMGMSSASSLSYEPPWQRQQQQQQQMRLQQLMQQQQNQMGAKMYAGGLGSRDPVAMALQQQRAREIMMGGGAGRPRGRPPLQPRAAPPPAGAAGAGADVVNLDSD